MDKKDKKIQELNDELQKYYTDEYMKSIHLDNFNNKPIQDLLKKFTLAHWSHKNRIIRNLQILKYTFITYKTDVITTCFKVNFEATSCIYGYIHSRAFYNIKTNKTKYEHTYVCTGPTYRSQDGEYRARLITWEQFLAVYNKYSEEFELIEEAVLKRLESGKLDFQTDFYYPEGYKINTREFEDSINTMRLPIKLYILCWIYDFYQIYTKSIENHVNPAYQYIMYQTEDIPILESILAKLGRDGYWKMQSRVSKYYTNVDKPDYNIQEPQCGQKIFPLTVFEAIRREDINFNVWREIYITNMAANLVLNTISPSFPFIIDWFYIQNAHAGLYDNISMHDKYLHSSIATDVSTQIKNIDKYNYVNQDRKKGPISNKFMRLSRTMQKSMIYADSDIRLTNLALCVTSEYVGRTLRDIPALIVNKEHQPGLELAFTDYGIFTRHMFEFVYSFYCMNTKIGIMHGDLHMNNATISRLYIMIDPNNKPYMKDPRIAYIVGNDVYAFSHFGLFSTIIDFSRAIIGDYDKLEHEFSPRFAELYFKEQRIRIMYMIYHYFPDIMKKYQEKLEALLLTNFPLMFKILTAVDTYVIMSNIAAMFSIDDAFTRGQIKIAPGAIKLLMKLSNQASELVHDNVTAAVEGKISNENDIEWPNLLIIKKNFSDWLLTPEKIKKENMTIVEIFNSNNDLKYDIDDYDSWGPLLSIQKEIELRKKYDQEVFLGIKKWLEYKQTDETAAIEELTSKYEQQEREFLQYEAWMLL